MGRHYRIALSLANLVYLRAWADLIPAGDGDLFYRKTTPGFSLYLALAGNVLLLSLVLFGIIRLAPKMPVWMRRLAPAAVLVMMGIGAAFLRVHIAPYIPTRAMAAGLSMLAIGAVIGTIRFPALALRMTRGFALAAMPCLAVTFLAPLYYLRGPAPLPADPPLAGRLATTPPVRVLWVVFDDWDYHLTFENHPNNPPVPTLLKLITRSFSAGHVLAVQTDTPVVDMATRVAIPSLLYGRLVNAEEVENSGTQHLQFADGGPDGVFGQGDSVFARFREKGWNAAAAGWYVPYCRIFAPLLSDCFWDVRYDQSSSASREPLRAALDVNRMLFETDGFSVFGRSLVTQRHFEEYEALLERGKRYAADPSLGLAFVHFNVPHPPYFSNSYVSELQAVDRAVSELLAAIHKAGLDSKTAVILTSDHPARLVQPTHPYVPLIVHLPDQDHPLVLDDETSALGIGSLTLAIAGGAVRSAGDVQRFLGNK